MGCVHARTRPQVLPSGVCLHARCPCGHAHACAHLKVLLNSVWLHAQYLCEQMHVHACAHPQVLSNEPPKYPYDPHLPAINLEKCKNREKKALEQVRATQGLALRGM